MEELLIAEPAVAPQEQGILSRMAEKGREFIDRAQAVGAVVMATVAFSAVGTAVESFTGTSEAFAGTPSAHIASGGGEGQDPNDVVAGGVENVAEAEHIDETNANIRAIWAQLGITKQVISTMHEGEVCADEGLISEGREHSPVPSEDTPVDIDGDVIFERPLSVWGNTCYNALVGHTEDGRLVAILNGCGNGEASALPPKPQTPGKVEEYVVKEAKDASGNLLPETPTGTFVFLEQCKDGSINVSRKVVYNQDGEQPLGECNVGSKVIVKELTPLAGQWVDESAPRQIHAHANKGNNRFVFIDREVGTPVTPPTPAVVPPVVVETPPVTVVTPPVTVVVPPPVATTPPSPPVITPYNAPPGLEQGIEDTTYDVFFQADAPHGDTQQVVVTTNNGECASASPAVLYQEPDLYESTISFGGDSCVGDDIVVTATDLDVNTGLSAVPVVEDLGDIQPTPSFGN